MSSAVMLASTDTLIALIPCACADEHCGICTCDRSSSGGEQRVEHRTGRSLVARFDDQSDHRAERVDLLCLLYTLLRQYGERWIELLNERLQDLPCRGYLAFNSALDFALDFALFFALGKSQCALFLHKLIIFQEILKGVQTLPHFLFILRRHHLGAIYTKLPSRMQHGYEENRS